MSKMDLDTLRYEVQRLDGTPAAVTNAVSLIVEEYERSAYLPKSIEYGFFEEFFKNIIDWIGKGQEKDLLEMFTSIKATIDSDDEFISPFAGTSGKRRFGAQLNFVRDFIEIYLRSDMASKDEQYLKDDSKKAKRLRLLLCDMYRQDGPITVSSLQHIELYEELNAKTPERDLTQLVEWGFLRKKAASPKKIFYELTSKAHFFRARIEESVAASRALEEYDEEAAESGSMFGEHALASLHNYLPRNTSSRK